MLGRMLHHKRNSTRSRSWKFCHSIRGNLAISCTASRYSLRAAFSPVWCVQVSLSQSYSVTIDLLYAPPTIPLVCCHINSFRRASRCGEAMARRRKAERRAGIASRGMWSDWSVSPPVCGHRGVPARGVVPDRCNASGAAGDACRDTTAWARRAERAADGGVVDIPRALSVSPRAPWITAQRVARFHPYNSRNCLPPKKLRRDIQ